MTQPIINHANISKLIRSCLSPAVKLTKWLICAQGIQLDALEFFFQLFSCIFFGVSASHVISFFLEDVSSSAFLSALYVSLWLDAVFFVLQWWFITSSVVRLFSVSVWMCTFVCVCCLNHHKAARRMRVSDFIYGHVILCACVFLCCSHWSYSSISVSEHSVCQRYWRWNNLYGREVWDAPRYLWSVFIKRSINLHFHKYSIITAFCVINKIKTQKKNKTFSSRTLNIHRIILKHAKTRLCLLKWKRERNH